MGKQAPIQQRLPPVIPPPPTTAVRDPDPGPEPDDVVRGTGRGEATPEDPVNVENLTEARREELAKKKRRKGRAATIVTGPRGLLEEPDADKPYVRKRSLT